MKKTLEVNYSRGIVSMLPVPVKGGPEAYDAYEFEEMMMELGYRDFYSFWEDEMPVGDEDPREDTFVWDFCDDITECAPMIMRFAKEHSLHLCAML